MKKLSLLILVLCAVLLMSCQKTQYAEESFFYMDTLAALKISSNENDSIEKCRQLLNRLDTYFSRHNEEGITYKYNLSESGIEVNEDIKLLVGIADDISKKTDNAFSIFSGGLTSLWENSSEYPSEQQLKKAVDSVQSEAVFDGLFFRKTNRDSILEFGGIAKGYACDKAIELLKENGVESGMITFSSSVGVFGKNPDGKDWKIAIKNPINTDEVLGYISLNSGGLSVSGDYERFYEINGKKYNHIIDTKTGLPVDNGVHSVVVVSETCAEADALSTAFFVMGHDKVREQYGQSDSISYLFVTNQGVFMNDAMKTIFTTK